jgi:alginate O-acetyltransferase complex protein AlgJ
MFRHYRRFWIVPAAALLVAPLLIGLVMPDRADTSSAEQRTLAPPPSLPRTMAGWFALPQQVSAFLTDHFGLRRRLIKANAVIQHYYLASGNDLVFIGENRSLFYRGDHLLQSSAGVEVRSDQVIATADLMARMQTILAARGIGFFVASPPNSATIYPERLPSWLQREGRSTEYDLFVDALRQRHVRFVDLRPPLLAAKSDGKLYWEHDSHWTALGALIGFNAVVAAAGLPDWQIDPAEALSAVVERNSGDLARMLDLTGWLEEAAIRPAQPKVASYRTLTPQPFATFVVTANHPGPTVLIIGDSFTGGIFTPFVTRNAGRYIWMHHQFCGFDWKIIDEYHPDFVWYMPTERLIPCEPNRKPVGMPEATSVAHTAAG